MSPSPHGRVGTGTGKTELVKSVASPSPHGRVGTAQWHEVHQNVAKSPSPHGRVGTELWVEGAGVHACMRACVRSFHPSAI